MPALVPERDRRSVSTSVMVGGGGRSVAGGGNGGSLSAAGAGQATQARACDLRVGRAAPPPLGCCGGGVEPGLSRLRVKYKNLLLCDLGAPGRHCGRGRNGVLSSTALGPGSARRESRSRVTRREGHGH